MKTYTFLLFVLFSCFIQNNLKAQNREFSLIKLTEIDSSKSVHPFSNPYVYQFYLKNKSDISFEFWQLQNDSTTIDSNIASLQIVKYDFCKLTTGNYLFLWYGYDGINKKQYKGKIVLRVYIDEILTDNKIFTIN